MLPPASLPFGSPRELCHPVPHQQGQTEKTDLQPPLKVGKHPKLVSRIHLAVDSPFKNLNSSPGESIIIILKESNKIRQKALTYRQSQTSKSLPAAKVLRLLGPHCQ